jgi:hypothetical protein
LSLIKIGSSVLTSPGAVVKMVAVDFGADINRFLSLNQLSSVFN